MMVPRFKGKPNFDFSQACPLCGYKIQQNELMRLASHTIQCPKCSGVFDEMESKLAEIRRCTHRRPLGSAEFVQALEGAMKWRLAPQKEGRPPKIGLDARQSKPDL
jgi:hypothetical protein